MKIKKYKVLFFLVITIMIIILPYNLSADISHQPTETNINNYAICLESKNQDECLSWLENNNLGHKEPKNVDEFKEQTFIEYQDLDFFSKLIIDNPKKEIKADYVQFGNDAFNIPVGAGIDTSPIKTAIMGVVGLLATFINAIAWFIYWLVMVLCNFVTSSQIDNIFHNTLNYILNTVFNINSPTGLGAKLIFATAFIFTILKIFKSMKGRDGLNGEKLNLKGIVLTLVVTLVVANVSYQSIKFSSEIERQTDTVMNNILGSIQNDKDMQKFLGSNKDYAIKNAIYENMALQQFTLTQLGVSVEDIKNDETKGNANLAFRTYQLMKNKDNYVDTDAKEFKNRYVLSMAGYDTDKSITVESAQVWQLMAIPLRLLSISSIGIIEFIVLTLGLALKIIKMLVFSFLGFVILKKFLNADLGSIFSAFKNAVLWALVAWGGFIAILLLNAIIMMSIASLTRISIGFAIIFNILLLIVAILLIKNFQKVMSTFKSIFAMIPGALTGSSTPAQAFSNVGSNISDLMKSMNSSLPWNKNSDYRERYKAEQLEKEQSIRDANYEDWKMKKELGKKGYKKYQNELAELSDSDIDTRGLVDDEVKDFDLEQKEELNKTIKTEDDFVKSKKELADKLKKAKSEADKQEILSKYITKPNEENLQEEIADVADLGSDGISDSDLTSDDKDNSNLL